MAVRGRKPGIYIAPGRKVWPHEMRVAEILALNGHYIEFLEEGSLHTADIRLDGVEYEIKSPERFNVNTFRHTIKNALKQSCNLIIDLSRMKGMRDDKVYNFLVGEAGRLRQIKRLIVITKNDEVIDVFKGL